MSELLAQEKLFYERFAALHNDPQLMKVVERYGIAAFRRSSVLEGFEAFLKAQNFSGKCVVEIGTLRGLTAVVLSRYFDRVVTVDIVPDPQREEIAAMLDIHNIAFVTVRNNAEKAKVIGACEFDAAFVDGDHAKDQRDDFDLVKRCGRVLCHEYWDAQPVVEATLKAAGGRIETQGKWALWRSA